MATSNTRSTPLDLDPSVQSPLGNASAPYAGPMSSEDPPPAPIYSMHLTDDSQIASIIQPTVTTYLEALYSELCGYREVALAKEVDDGIIFWRGDVDAFTSRLQLHVELAGSVDPAQAVVTVTCWSMRHGRVAPPGYVLEFPLALPTADAAKFVITAIERCDRASPEGCSPSAWPIDPIPEVPNADLMDPTDRLLHRLKQIPGIAAVTMFTVPEGRTTGYRLETRTMANLGIIHEVTRGCQVHWDLTFTNWAGPIEQKDLVIDAQGVLCVDLLPLPAGRPEIYTEFREKLNVWLTRPAMVMDHHALHVVHPTLRAARNYSHLLWEIDGLVPLQVISYAMIRLGDNEYTIDAEDTSHPGTIPLRGIIGGLMGTVYINTSREAMVVQLERLIAMNRQ